MHITNEEDLAGLPDGEKEDCRPIGKSKEQRWLVDYLGLFLSYYSFMEYADNRKFTQRNCPCI